MILTSVCLTVVIFWFISVHQQDTEGKTSRESSSSCHMLDDLARTIDEHLEGTVHSLSLQFLSRVFFFNTNTRKYHKKNSQNCTCHSVNHKTVRHYDKLYIRRLICGSGTLSLSLKLNQPKPPE